MPHYRDGTPATLGDRVRGHNHGAGRPVEGHVIRIIASDSCNAEVAYPVLATGADGNPVPHVVTGWATLGDLEKV